MKKIIYIFFILQIIILLLVKAGAALENDSFVAFNSTDYYKQARYNFLLFSPKGFDNAIDLYKKALGIDPNNSKAYSGLAEVYSYIGHFKLQNKQAYERYYAMSFSNIKKALRISPDSLETRRALAINYLHLKWLKRARIESNKLINKYPDSAEAYYVYWSATGKKPDDPFIDKVFELNPNYLPAHIELANSYFYLKRNYRKAAEYYEKSIEIADSPELRDYLGTTFRTQGNLRKAIEQYKKALELDKSFASAYMNLGITLFYMRNYEECIKNLKQAVTLNKNHPDSFFYLGNTYEIINDNLSAIKYYKQFLTMAINDYRYSEFVSKAKNSLYKLNP